MNATQNFSLEAGRAKARLFHARERSSLPDRFWDRVEFNASNGCWEWTAATSCGYGNFGVGGTRTNRAHRLVWQDAYGDIPEGLEVDHKCWNRLCCNPDHLQIVSRSENLQNRSGLSANNTSGVRGVSWSKKYKRWMAMGAIRGKRTFVGYFKDISKADLAIRQWRRENHPNSLMDRGTSL